MSDILWLVALSFESLSRCGHEYRHRELGNPQNSDWEQWQIYTVISNLVLDSGVYSRMFVVEE